MSATVDQSVLTKTDRPGIEADRNPLVSISVPSECRAIQWGGNRERICPGLSQLGASARR